MRDANYKRLLRFALNDRSAMKTFADTAFSMLRALRETWLDSMWFSWRRARDKQFPARMFEAMLNVRANIKPMFGVEANARNFVG